MIFFYSNNWWRKESVNSTKFLTYQYAPSKMTVSRVGNSFSHRAKVTPTIGYINFKLDGWDLLFSFFIYLYWFTLTPISFSFPPPSSPPLPTTTLHLVQEPHPHCSQTHLILVPHQFAHTHESSPTQPNQSPQHKHRKRNWIWSQRSKTPKNSFQRIRLHGHNETASTMQRLLQNKKRNGEEENKTPNIEQKIQYR